MDARTLLSKYDKTVQFLNKYSIDIDDFVSILEPARYALRLEGKTMNDITAADTLQHLYALAIALDVRDSSHKKKHTLKQEIIEKYNSVFTPVVHDEGHEETKGEEQNEEEEKKEEERNEEALVTYRFGHLFLQENTSADLLPKLSLHDFFQSMNFHSEGYMFDLDFWLQLNNLDDDVMFIVDDDIIESFGYQRSENAKNNNTRTNFFRMIQKNFRQERDYTLSLQERRDVDRKGSPYRNELSMTKNAFKLACLKAGTRVSEQIYQFLIDLEKHVSAYLKYECEYATEQSVRATNALQMPRVLNKFQQNRLKNKREQKFLYVMTTQRYHANDVYKIGYTVEKKSRLGKMNNARVGDEKMFTVYSVLVYDTFKCEQYIHDLLKEYHYEKEFYMILLRLIIRLIDFVSGFFNQTNNVLTGISDELNTIPVSVLSVTTV